MNLHSGCILAVTLLYVCGQVIDVFLVNGFIGPEPAALNTFHVDVIPLLCCCYAKVVFMGSTHMSDLE